MSDLVERYVQQVGRYLPAKERKEVEAELRSQIQDQLEDRFAGSPTQAHAATVLAELGDPRKMAASYGSQQYLVGPELYPTLVQVLRRILVIVPTLVVIATVLGAVASSQPYSLPGLFIETAASAVQAVLILIAVVVLFFAILQNTGTDVSGASGPKKQFDPLALPPLDDPYGVDRAESTFGIAIGTFFALVLVYFLRVGGLTLRFNLGNPGEVLPVSTIWLIILIVSGIAQVLVNVWALWRNRWTAGLWFAETVFELMGHVGVYFVFLKPLFGRVLTTVPALANLPFMAGTPEIFLGVAIAITLLSKGHRLFKLWTYQTAHR